MCTLETLYIKMLIANANYIKMLITNANYIKKKTIKPKTQYNIKSVPTD
jgi:hypothetical protein